MKTFRYIFRSLIHYKKQHLAVFFATLISTAVLTGALIVGDSVSYSLENLVHKRLGKINYSLFSGDRFVRAELAKDISTSLNIPCAALLKIEGVSINPDNQKRISKTHIVGIDKDFWELSDIEIPNLKKDEIYISNNLAERLEIEVGQEILLRIRNADFVPIQAPFSSNENPSVAVRVKVKKILEEDELARFSFRKTQTSPYNIFINREYLAEQLELENYANTIIISGNESINEGLLNDCLRKEWKLEDASLSLNKIEETNTYDLLSERVFIDHSLTKKIDQINIKHENLLSYFVNSLKFEDKETPYSFVNASSGYLFNTKLGDKEAIINSWLAEDLGIDIGDSLQLDYFIMGPLQSLEVKTAHFKVKQILNIHKNGYHSLMPSFPGLSDAGNCSEWDASIPIDLKKIRDKDEQYWDDFRGSPKAFISLNKGLELWDNRFGNYTSIRFFADDLSKEEMEEKILASISPKDIGLTFVNIKSQSLKAASSGVDFGELFLSLSFFIIAAAILLLVIIYSMNLESRITEIASMHAIGFSKSKLVQLLFSESALSIFVASIAGGFIGIAYNYFMIHALNSIWNDAIHADALEIFVQTKTLIIGVVSGIIISLLSIYLVTTKKLKKTIASLMKDQTYSITNKGSKTFSIIGLISFIAALLMVLYSLNESVASNSAIVLTAGFLILITGISFFSFLLRRQSKDKKQNSHSFSFSKLVMLNAGRNRGRSLAVIGLLALGTFTVIITGANRKTFSGDSNQRQSGTGGYKLWVENTVPILHDLNTEEGQSNYGLSDVENIDHIEFVQFNSLAGDDASCLNLNQVQNPQILGVNADLFDSLGAFSFAQLLKENDHPWLDLDNYTEPNTIPAIADQTVIQWGLMKSIGDTLKYLNEAGQEINLVLVGGLNASIFQGNILISSENFSKHFPSSGGSKIMLVNTPKESQKEVQELLNNTLVDYGVEVSETQVRQAAFYSVTNTYLTIFMILGGLGIILGTLGLGIVLWRNTLDRKQEITIMKSVGYTKSQLIKLLFSENIFLLIGGIFLGIISAFIGILPSLLSPAFHIPGNFLFLLVFIIFMSGLIWIYVPIRILMKEIY